MSVWKPVEAPVLVRWMGRLDLPRVLEIEESVFADPWGEADIISRIRRWNCIGLVVEAGNLVVGHGIYVYRRPSLSVRRLAVHPDSCRFDVVPHLVAYLKAATLRHGCSRITVPVRETDLDDQRILRATGFRAVRLLRGRFQDTGEDAYLMRCNVATALETRPNAA